MQFCSWSFCFASSLLFPHWHLILLQRLDISLIESVLRHAPLKTTWKTCYYFSSLVIGTGSTRVSTNRAPICEWFDLSLTQKLKLIGLRIPMYISPAHYLSPMWCTLHNACLSIHPKKKEGEKEGSVILELTVALRSF